MNKNFFNRILHLLDKRPQQGKRMIGIGSTALWELWQPIAELDQAAQQKRAERVGRKRQAGGGRKKDVLTEGAREGDRSMPAIGGLVILEATLDDTSNSRVH